MFNMATRTFDSVLVGGGIAERVAAAALLGRDAVCEMDASVARADAFLFFVADAGRSTSD